MLLLRSLDPEWFVEANGKKIRVFSGIKCLFPFEGAFECFRHLYVAVSDAAAFRAIEPEKERVAWRLRGKLRRTVAHYRLKHTHTHILFKFYYEYYYLHKRQANRNQQSHLGLMFVRSNSLEQHRSTATATCTDRISGTWPRKKLHAALIFRVSVVCSNGKLKI